MPLIDASAPQPKDPRAVPTGVLAPLFDLLSRPSRGVAEGTKRVVVDKGDLGDFFKGVGAGLEGKSSVHGFSDVLAQAKGKIKPSVLDSILGFGLDVGTDPLTYTTGGLERGIGSDAARVQAIKQATAQGAHLANFESVVDSLARQIEEQSPSRAYVKFAGKQVASSEGLVKAADKVVKTLAQGSDGEYRLAAKAFSRRAEMPMGLDKMVRLNEMNNAANYSKELTPLTDIASNLTPREAKKVSDAILSGNIDALKAEGLARPAPKGVGFTTLHDYASLYEKKLKQWADDEVSLGLLDKNKIKENYLPRILHGNEKNIERKAGGEKFVRIPGTDTPSALAPASSFSLDQLEKMGFKPETDIRAIMNIRGAKHYSKISRAKGVQDVIDHYGVKAVPANSPTLFNEDWVPATNIKHSMASRPGNADKFLPRTVVNGMNSLNTFLENPKVSSKILQNFDKVLNEWKFVVTASPQTRIRNAMSDFVMNAQNGVFDPRYYSKARQILQKVDEVNQADLLGTQVTKLEIPLKGKLKLNSDDIWKLYTENGGKAGFVSSDLYRDLAPFHKSTIADSAVAGKLPDAVVTALEKGSKGYQLGKRKLGNFADYHEDFFRLANFTKSLEDELPKGITSLKDATGQLRPEVVKAAERANDTVRHVNLDYGNLTQFEKTVGRRVVPFYSFMRQVIPQQVSLLFSHPGFMALYPKGVNLISGAFGGGPVDDPLVPDWIKKLSPYQIQAEKQGKLDFKQKLLKTFLGGSGNDSYVGTLAGTPIESLNRLEPLANIGIAASQGRLPSVKETFGEGANQVLSSASPLIKAPIELATGKSLFTGQSIESQGWANWLASQTPITRVGYSGATGSDNFRGDLTRFATGLDIRPVTEGSKKSEGFRQLQQLTSQYEHHSTVNSKGRRKPTDDTGVELQQRIKELQRFVQAKKPKPGYL